AGSLRRDGASASMNPRGILRELLRSGPGRVGLVMAVLLSVISAWVLVSYPWNYGPARWSNPEAWAALPEAAAPAWTTLLAGPSAEHGVLSATAPTDTRTSGPAQVRSYDMRFDYQQDLPPTFLSFALGQISYQTRPPSLAVSLTRPDGQTVTLYRAV